MQQFSLAHYATHFDLGVDEQNKLNLVMADQAGFEESVAGSLDYWHRTVVPSVGNNPLAVFVLRSHLYSKAIRCAEKCGLSIRFVAVLSRIIADATEQIVLMEADLEGGANE